ncbi:MAG: DUF6427 family protein [Owenweeksia sp.]|nr:DUF6427 family protein [Owenweeksia sp.]
MRTLSLAAGKRYGYVLFDVGCLIAIMMLIRPEALIFLLIGWLGVLSFGRLFFRALLMPLVGLVAIWFMLFSISFGLGDAGMVEQVALSFTEVPLNLAVGQGLVFKGWGHLVPLAVVLLPALFHLPRVFNRANVLKRQVYTFLIFTALVLLVTGSLVENYRALWIWLLIPLAVFLVNFIQDQQKKWRKDVIYLLLLLYLGLSLFF